MAELDEYEAILGDGAKEEAEPEAVADKEQKDRSDRDKDREKRRSRSRDRKERKRSRSRDRDRDRRKERDNDYRVSSRRSRSRSRGRKDREQRDRDRPRDRDRGGDRGGAGGFRDRGRDMRRAPPPRRRDMTPPEVRLAREKERELKELERATRTVFAFNLNIKADERDIFEFFAKAGEVTDIRLITDRHTKRSKGLAYVEFSKQEEVFVALALTGQPMLGQPVMVKPAEAEKNMAWEAQQAAKQSNAAEAELAALGLGLAPLGPAAAVPTGPLRLQVTGFKQGLGEAEIQQIFEPFGPVESVTVVRDGAGQPINIAYVVFNSETDGQNAKAHWHGKVLLDHELSVVVAPLKTQPLPHGGGGGDAGGVGDLDDGDFRLNTQTRAALMNRLANSAGIGPTSGGLAAAGNPLLGAPLAAVPGMLPGMLAPSAGALSSMAAAAAAAVPGLTAAVPPGGMPLPGMPGAVPGMDLSLDQGLLGPPSPIPTNCLLLKNMFDAAQQAEPGWAEEVEDDVREECGKLGQVLHVFVDRTSRGFVYLKMGAVEGAAAAFKMLHGRFYNGNMIQAAYQFVQVYNQHFRL